MITTALGVGGALIATFLGRLVGRRQEGQSAGFIAAVLGAVIVLAVYHFSDNHLTALPEAFGEVQIVNQLRVRNNPITSLPAGFATMRATIDITGTKIDPASLSPQLRAKTSTEKPPGSKEEEKIIVRKPPPQNE